MNFKEIAEVGFGVVVSMALIKLINKDNRETSNDSTPTSFHDNNADNIKETDVEYVSESELTDAMELFEDDTPDNVDMLFIRPITFHKMSTAYSVMGEIYNAFEHDRVVSINDILSWVDDYDDVDLYTDSYRFDYRDKLKKYGWVDPCDFAIAYNNEEDCYYITNAVPVRLRNDEEDNNENKNDITESKFGKDCSVM